MRLIIADDILQNYCSYCNGEGCDGGGVGSIQECESIRVLRDVLDAQPTLRCANCSYFLEFRAKVGKGHCRRFDDVRDIDDYCSFIRKRTKEKKIASEGMFYEADNMVIKLNDR